MITLRIPASGRLLSTQLAGYGLVLAVHADGHSAWFGHDTASLECDPVVTTDASPQAVAESITHSALVCEAAVEADLIPGATGNNRIPVIRARATDPERAMTALTARERLLDTLEGAGGAFAAALLAGLGAPAPWLRDGSAAGKPMPGRGATQLDGVPYNIGSDIVRGLLRPVLRATKETNADALARLFTAEVAAPQFDRDRTRWSPDGTKLAPVCQWLAAIGLALLPVGLTSSGRARTPGFWRQPGSRGIALPVLERPVSLPRLRAILQRPELTAADGAREAARLRALGVSDVMRFSVVDASSGTMVAFSFAPASRLAL
ncbi:MAG: hypothetical protein ACLP50_01735 [Solirubrobacteraceae bacterium]